MTSFDNFCWTFCLHILHLSKQIIHSYWNANAYTMRNFDVKFIVVSWLVVNYIRTYKKDNYSDSKDEMKLIDDQFCWY